MVSKSGAIYWFQFGDLTCDDEYIGETSWTFGEKIQSAPEGPLSHTSLLQWFRPLPQLHWRINQPPLLGLISWVLGAYAGVTLKMTERSHF